MLETMKLLRDRGVQPTPQRMAVARFVLVAKSHPTADQVWEGVKRECPTISRATVYNTLNLLVGKGLLRIQVLREGTVVFDPFTEAHHHFIDEESGKIYDIPWRAVKVSGQEGLTGYEVRDYQVILRGKKKKN